LWQTVAIVALVSSVFCGPAGAQTASNGAADTHPFPKRVPAPSLDGGLEWINTTKPLTLADLRGKFVLLDFWTFCCINCIHVLPELQQLERAYANELVVVGVHSAKFEGEQDIRNIREAVLRYEIEHPVVNDANMAIWKNYGVQSWPTLVLIDPNGEAVWVGGGERKFADLKALLDRGLPHYRTSGALKPGPATFIVKPQPPNTPLRFPGKVLADEANNRLFIADSNHNRIVVADFNGKLQSVIGTGAVGRSDGGFDAATFHHPQGMSLVGNTLFVADTENHLLRKADLDTRQVTTIAGTGEQGDGFPGPTADGRFAGPPLSTALNSPWALWVHGDDSYIAVAGPHQIWKMPLDGLEIGPYAGNGREDIVDGPLLPAKPYAAGFASFAQPSGLASDGTQLFVADSEGSAIRAVPFDPAGRATTIVGVRGSLFDFGDVDGRYPRVRLQHPLGVAFHDGKLYVSDTYNNKIKEVDVAKRSCRTIAGSGQVGSDDSDNPLQATFNEPAGITAAGHRIFVADTNNHAIRVIDLSAGNRVSTLPVDGLSSPKASESSP
jgi:DNA-binding beta-propeller fold protein YncE